MHTTLTPALQDVRNARTHLQLARRGYHLAVMVAAGRGHTDAEIADALGTKPLYVTNTIREHKAGTCGCNPGGK
jgi:DNA-binding CsgD family transcriptional regulator